MPAISKASLFFNMIILLFYIKLIFLRLPVGNPFFVESAQKASKLRGVKR